MTEATGKAVARVALGIALVVFVAGGCVGLLLIGWRALFG